MKKSGEVDGYGARRPVVGVAIVLVVLGALVAPASARWARGFSDVNRDGDDIAVCSEEITLGAFLNHQIDSFTSQYPTFVGTPGVTPYPGNPIESIRVYSSEALAIANVDGTEVATVDVPLTYDSDDTGAYFFSGEETIPTPAGYGNGDTLYVWSFMFDDNGNFIELGIPLTIGDSIYDCPPTDLLWGGLSKGGDHTVNAYLPHTILFDASEVNPATLKLSVDNQPGVSLNYLGSIGTLGVARVNLNEAGLRCFSEVITLSGTAVGGYSYEGTIDARPVGPACEIDVS